MPEGRTASSQCPAIPEYRSGLFSDSVEVITIPSLDPSRACPSRGLHLILTLVLTLALALHRFNPLLGPQYKEILIEAFPNAIHLRLQTVEILMQS